jgi:calcineurin-like phosphoesterase family protein
MIIEFENQIKKFNNIWFASDFHFGHKFIIQACNRPFSTIEEMDSILIENANKVVNRDDLMIFLGDFCQWKDKATQSFYHYFSQFNCLNWAWVYGNHDKKIKNALKSHKNIIYQGDLLDINIDGTDVMLSHYPMKSWDKSFHGSLHGFGHVHHQDGYEQKNSVNPVCL